MLFTHPNVTTEGDTFENSECAPRMEISLGASLNRRFYLSLIFLSALERVFKKTQALRMPDVETAPADGFRSFVNKLGHICESAKGGDKVTAFAVLQLGTIQYYFTSNRRDEEDYQRTAHYITDILNTLGRVKDDEIRTSNGDQRRSPVSSQLLSMIIRFNQSRIKGYICHMCDELDFCINFVRREDRSEEGQAVLRSLEDLQPLVIDATGKACDIDKFADASQKVMQMISTIHNPSFKEFLRRRTHNNTDRSAPWVVVSHSIGRLLSYYYAVDILLSARRNWPQLFEDFEVHWVPSREPREPTIPRKLNASMILGKMSNDEAIIREYRDYAAALERSGIPLNDKITESARQGRFLPFVHAEVNLLDFILRLQRETRARGEVAPTFFLNDKYIGCSKPTCRLCELWFNHHPSGVAVREGHRNLYGEWCPPAVYDDENAPAVARERNKILEDMIPIIRNEAFRNLRERCASRRPNDSHDTPSNVPPDQRSRPDFVSAYSRLDELDDLTSQMGQVDISDMEDQRRAVDWGQVAAWDEPSVARAEVSVESESTPELTEGATGDEDDDGEVDADDDDHDGGGARL